MKKYLLTILALLSLQFLQGQVIPEGGEELVLSARLSKLKTPKAELGSVSMRQDSTPALVFDTRTQPQFIYHLNTTLPLRKKAFRQGQVMLLSFEAKTEEASLETGEAKALWIIRQSESHKDNIQFTVSIGSEWRTYYFPIQLSQRVPADLFKLVVQYGFPPQKFLVRQLSLQAFPADITQENLPKTRLTYPGQEADAPWRKEAEARIKQNRQGEVSLKFVDKKGKPIANKAMQITLQKHHFGWGAAVNAKVLLNQPAHLNHVKEAFNQVVFENDLKIKRWKRPDNQLLTLEALTLLNKEGIGVKGHVLIWPGYKYLTPEFRRLENNPQKVNKLIDNHLQNILKATNNQITHWDIVNEAYTNKDLQRITGSEEILYKGFRVLYERNPDIPRFTNEYGIISKGGLDRKKQEWYYDFIQRIDKNTGGLVDGIGIQCHMGTDLTPPEKVLSLLDYYAELDKKISVSEFTLDIDDDEMRYQYTRDFLIAAFSHPSVHEFLFWGYFGPHHEKAALYDQDWNLLPMGKAYFELVHDEWKTDIHSTSDRKGRIIGKAFYGTYTYRFVYQNKLIEGEFDFQPGTEQEITIELP